MNDGALPGFAHALLVTVGATAVVAVVAWVALSLLRRVGGQGVGLGLGLRGGLRGGLRKHVPGRPAGKLRIVQTLPLGTRERAVLIADDEHEYLLGVAAGGVSLLVSRARRGGKVPEPTEANGASAVSKADAAPVRDAEAAGDRGSPR